MNPIGTLPVREREEEAINLQPIQAAGRLTSDAMKALIAYGDGYSACDLCLKPFRLDTIKKPDIAQFHTDVADWLGVDQIRIMPGARRAFQAVCLSLLSKGDTALITQFGHYTIGLSVEQAGATWREIPADETNHITPDATAEKIELVKKETGSVPKLINVAHFDYQLANEHDIKGIIKVAHEYDVPVLYNGAYTIGVMPVNHKDFGADFYVASGHKSMAAPAPTGVLGMNDEWAEKVFRTTDATGDVTGRKFGVKEVQLLGCTVMGGPLFAMMASFPHVKERVKHWDTELENARWFVDQMLKIEGTSVVSEMPRKHTITKIKTDGFNKIADTHKKRGFFLTKALSSRKITGPFPGATREWKFSTYGLTRKQVEYTANAFKEIALENGLNVSD